MQISLSLTLKLTILKLQVKTQLISLNAIWMSRYA